MLRDFVTKSRYVRPEARYYYTAKALSSFVDPGIGRILEEVMTTGPSPKPLCDVAIITVVPRELTAAKLAFSIPENRREDRYVNGLRYWETAFPSAGSGKELKVVVTMVGEARTLPCAVACGRLFGTYDVGTCILVGIAAGLKEKVKLGDVVAADTILDYEGQRLEEGGPKKRPVSYLLDPQIARDLAHFEPKKHGWMELMGPKLTTLETMEKLPDFPKNWEPNYHVGVVLAGEKLLADGSLPEMRESYHEKIRAAEMEGSGFARVCREYGKPWLVFRGVSDFGRQEETGKRQMAGDGCALCGHGSDFVLGNRLPNA